MSSCACKGTSKAREQPQIELRAISRVEGEQADLAAFLPVARRDLEELDGFLEHLAREVYKPGCAVFWSDCSRMSSCVASCVARLARCPVAALAPGLAAAAARVGAGAGALAAITPIWAVCWSTPLRWPRWRLSCARGTQRLDRDLLLTAAIVHDLGKMRQSSPMALRSSQRGKAAAGSSSRACGCWPATLRLSLPPSGGWLWSTA